MSDVSPEELLWAAGEVAKLLGSAIRHDVLVHDRLHALIHEQRGFARALIEDRIVAPLRVGASGAGAGGAPQPPRTPVTVADVRKAGLTLEMIVAKDATLTARALILAGILQSSTHLRELGIAQFADFLRLVGQPRDVSRWLREATQSDTAWRGDFLPYLQFTFSAWLTTRGLLKPADLCFLDFWLGAHLETRRDACWPLAARDAPAWLAIAPRDIWIESKQLTGAQYDALLGQSGRR